MNLATTQEIQIDIEPLFKNILTKSTETKQGPTMWHLLIPLGKGPGMLLGSPLIHLSSLSLFSLPWLCSVPLQKSLSWKLSFPDLHPTFPQSLFCNIWPSSVCKCDLCEQKKNLWCHYLWPGEVDRWPGTLPIVKHNSDSKEIKSRSPFSKVKSHFISIAIKENQLLVSILRLTGLGWSHIFLT